ncbi:MAG TPA: DUF192 domain-containing protein [Thermoanaerobaculia bacterium]|nr:DUF192 domain-containing protein [Thermoanaerobaculia bacterium]
MRGPFRLALAALVLAVAACAADRGAKTSEPAGTAKPPASGPRVVMPNGATISVEVALTEQEKAQGLMFRESMPRDAGMVFPFEGLEIRPFWMKNCHFPLDLVYATKDGTVVDVLKALPPCPPDPAPCESAYPKAKADTVLEVNAGVADATGAVAGAKLRWMEIPGR